MPTEAIESLIQFSVYAAMILATLSSLWTAWITMQVMAVLCSRYEDVDPVMSAILWFPGVTTLALSCAWISAFS